MNNFQHSTLFKKHIFMSENKLNKIKVIIPFYNASNFIDACITSVLTQDYENYEVLFIDDNSTDDSYSKIPSGSYKTDDEGTPIKNEKGEFEVDEHSHPLLKKTKCLNVKAWKSGTRNSALPNIHNGILNFCIDKDDIVVIVCGDDSLIGKGVLSNVNDFYNEHDCWLTYGSYRRTDRVLCTARPYNEANFVNIRDVAYKMGHMFTFRAGLYRQIFQQDPDAKCLKDNDGNWYKHNWNYGIVYPMLEMSGFERVKFNPNVLYLYNRENPLNTDKIDIQGMLNIQEEILKKEKFKKIIELT